MDSVEYDKYSGHNKRDPIIMNMIIFHNKVKKYYISKYSANANIVVDVGSGRGSDLKYWIEYNIKKVIGIEPSIESMKLAIKRYIAAQKQNNNTPKVQYLNGIGNKLWKNGDASLRDEDKQRFINTFTNIKGKVDSIHLFWTIHYMMDTPSDFINILKNIKSTLKKNGTVTILCMDGEKINKLFNRSNGSYIIKHNDTIVFQLDPLYDYKNTTAKERRFGKSINVELIGTYGLEKGIKENLVNIKYLEKVMLKNGFDLVEKTNFLDIPIEQRNDLHKYEEPISQLYWAFVFKKI